MPLPSSEVHMIWLVLGFAIGWYAHLAKDTYLIWRLR